MVARSWLWWAVACGLVYHGDGVNGDWRLQYPPWGESGTPTSGSPKIWFPFIGPFTRHGCFPSRYMSARIAISHINRRDPTFCPAIATLKNKFEFTYDLADSNSNGVGSARAALKFLNNASKKVKVILGPNGSGSSMSMSNILGVFSIPHISWAATNAALSNKATYPMFFRVVSPDSLTMRVLAGWLHNLKFKVVNLVYFDADFQSGQAQDFLGPAKASFGMTVNIYKIPNSGPGGAKVSSANMVHTVNALRAIRSSGWRVVTALTINEEAYDLIKAAYDMKMMDGEGWMWCGGDGFSGGQLAGQLARVIPFKGVVFMQAITKGPTFPAYAAKWAELMPKTLRPEFDQMKLCINKSAGSTEDLCINRATGKTNPEFKGWVDGKHDVKLQCEGYTGLAYDAAVTLAVVADKLLSKGKKASELTNTDWLNEMRALSLPGVSFDCLTGKVSFNKNQERDMPMAIFQWQLGSLVAPTLLTWDGVLGYRWVVGAKVVWPSGATGTVTKASEFAVPSGLPPGCSKGSVYNNSLLKCQLCPKGTFQAAGDGGSCLKCFNGKYQNKAGETGCDDCTVGKFAGVRGMSKCEDCSAGTYLSSKAGKICDMCTNGYYQSQPGASRCEQCALATYSASQGGKVCTDCPAGKTTDFVGSIGLEECGCAEELYQPASNANSCSSCPFGMTCKFGSEEKNIHILMGMSGNLSAGGASRRLQWPKKYINGKEVVAPMVDKDYYTKADAVMSVYQCGASGQCAGGLPESCSQGRMDLVCALCPDDQTPSGADCNECSSLNKIAPIVVFLVLIPAPLIMYHFTNSPVVSNAPIALVASLSLGIMVTVAQILGTFGQLNVPWPDKIHNGLDTFSFVIGSPDTVTLECLVGQKSTSSFLVRAVVPYCVLFAFLGLYFASVGASLLGGRHLRLQFDKIFNSMGHLCQMIFIAFVGMTSVPMQCFSHPNGKTSVVQYPEVLCGAGDHNLLVVMSVVLICTVIVPFVCVSFWATWEAPRITVILENAGHYVRFRFLLYRFRPDVWWWGLVFILRQTVLGFAPMVQPDDPSVQIIYCVSTLVFYLAVQCWYCPWKTQELNFLDASSCVFLCILMVTVASFMPATGWSGGHEVVMWLFLVFVIAINAVLVVSVGFSLFKYGAKGEFGIRYPRNKTVEVFANEWADIAKEGELLSVDEWVAVFESMNNFDRRLLDKAQACLKTCSRGVVGHGSKTPARLTVTSSKCASRAEDSPSHLSPSAQGVSMSDIMSRVNHIGESVKSASSVTGERCQALEAAIGAIQKERSGFNADFKAYVVTPHVESRKQLETALAAVPAGYR